MTSFSSVCNRVPLATGDPSAYQRLIEDCLAGEEDAWRRLLDQYEPLVSSFARSLSSNTEDAKDITAQVFLRLYQSLHTFREGASFRTWLLKIVRNTFVDVCVRDADHGHLSLDAPIPQAETTFAEHLVDTARSPEAMFLQQEAVRQMEEGIRHLPRYQRQALTLFMQGRSYEEIARETGLSMGTVKSRINRARRTLSARLEEE